MMCPFTMNRVANNRVMKIEANQEGRHVKITNAKFSSRIRQALLAMCLIMSITAPLPAQEQMVTPNYVGVDIRAIIQAVSAVTGRNFIIDPRVRQEVTMISSTPMSPDAFYEAFQSILQVHGYAAVTTGDVIKIIPDASVRQFPTPTDGAVGDDIVTRVIRVQNVGAAQLDGGQGIADAGVDFDVAGNDGNRRHVDVGGAQRHDQGHRVIRRGIGVDQEGT